METFGDRPTELQLNGQPLVLPPGPVPPGFRDAIEKSIANLIPPGRRGAVLGVRDLRTGRTTFGVAANLDGKGNWKAAIEGDWDGDLSGRVVLVGSF